MDWKNIRRFTVLSLLVSLAAAVLLGVVACLPGSIEGNYNSGGSLASSCGCDSKTIARMQDGRWVTYRTAHPPANLSGRYVTRKDGVVEIYFHPLEEEKQDSLIATAYPRLLYTKFVFNDGEVHRLLKLPVYGAVSRAYRDQEVRYTTLPQGGRLRRAIYDADLKLLRKEASVGPRKWMEIKPGEPLPPEAFDWKPLSIFNCVRPRRKAGEESSHFTPGKNLGLFGVSNGVFGKVLRGAMDHDPSHDPFYAGVVELIVVFDGQYYQVWYEDHPDNPEGARGNRFRITPLVAVTPGGKVFKQASEAEGHSFDKEMLAIFKQAADNLNASPRKPRPATATR